MKRWIIGAGVIAFAAILPADPASAHGGNGGSSSDYRIEITGFEGDARGFELRSVELGNRVEIRRTTAAQVMVLGYSGEPYLRLDDRGVWENVNSPAHFLNLDRFASTTPPPTATAEALPQWQQLSGGSSVRWHDHRTHWMGNVPPPEVQANPDVKRVVFGANRLDLVVDGHNVTALVRVTWLPPPSHTRWLIGISIAASLLVVALTQVGGVRRRMPKLVVVGAAAGLLGQGLGPVRVVASAIIVLLALAAVLVRKPLLSVIASAAVSVLAVTRLEVFEHQLVRGVVGGPSQRVSLAVSLTIGIAVVFAQIVTWLSPTSPAPKLAPGTNQPSETTQPA